VQIKVSTRVLRTIDKCGGLDEYLLGETSARVRELGVTGWELRWRIMQTGWWKKRSREERKRLGLDTLEELMGPLDQELVGRNGDVVSEQVLKEQIKAYDEEAKQEEIVLAEDDVQDKAVGNEGFMAEQLPPATMPGDRV
jgi:large subunit ribosomal protein L28